MVYSIRRHPDRWRAGGVWAGLAVMAAVLFAAGLYLDAPADREAVVVQTVCRKILDNTTEGRQALVSSVWWPPLPVLLRLPLTGVLGADGTCLASRIVSAWFGAAVLVLLAGILRAWGLGRERLLTVFAVAAYPPFLSGCLNGSSAALTVFLALLTLYGLVQWLAGQTLRHLIYFGLGSAGLLLADFGGALWLLPVFLALALERLVRRTGRQEKEAVLILALLPPFYAAGLWFLMNWLVMGDALYFLQSLRGVAAGDDGGVCWSGPAGWCGGGAALPAAALALSAWKRDRAGLTLCVLTGGFVGVALALAFYGMIWDAAPVLLLCLFPAGILCIGYVAGKLFAFSRSGRVALSVIPLLVVLCAGVEAHFAGPRAGPEDGRDRDIWLPRIERHVLSRSEYPKVFVCGYDSFLLLGPDPGPIFAHALDFNFHQAKEDYYGHDLYVLVHAPEGRSAMDSVHWKYPNMYRLGHRSTLYDRTFGNWRLFEIIQAPRGQAGRGIPGNVLGEP